MCTIAASTSFPEPFETPSDRKRLGWVHKQFAGSRHSDHIALLSAYQAWEDARYSNSEKFAFFANAVQLMHQHSLFIFVQSMEER